MTYATETFLIQPDRRFRVWERRILRKICRSFDNRIRGVKNEDKLWTWKTDKSSKYLRFINAQRLKWDIWLGWIWEWGKYKRLETLVKKTKRRMNDLWTTWKITMMANWMNNAINREICHKLVEKTKPHKGL